MKVVVYENWYNPKHVEVARAFAEGVDGSVLRDVRRPMRCDVAVIFGLVKRSYPVTHAKASIIEQHKGRRLVVIESAFLIRDSHYSVGFGGINGLADFNAEGVPPDRWLGFGLKSKRWIDRDGPVVVCGQLPWDTNVQDVDHPLWCRRAVEFYADRGDEVWFRPHPKIKERETLYRMPRGVTINRGPLKPMLARARAVVVYNSNTGVNAAVAGVPVVACARSAMSWPVASHGFEAELKRPSRTAWLAKLGYSQWSLNEMRRGDPWRHLMGVSHGAE